MRLGTAVLFGGLLIGVAACSVTPVSPKGGATPGVHEWRGQIVELRRDEGYMVVRSRERLLDHVFRITPQTQITSEAAVPLNLEVGQWVTVHYHDGKAEPRPPTALRVDVIP
ncbi:MAG: hypothetical protein ACE5G5_08545 [Candidatus Methylomirabilales bacterium]